MSHPNILIKNTFRLANLRSNFFLLLYVLFADALLPLYHLWDSLSGSQTTILKELTIIVFFLLEFYFLIQIKSIVFMNKLSIYLFGQSLKSSVFVKLNNSCFNTRDIFDAYLYSLSLASFILIHHFFLRVFMLKFYLLSKNLYISELILSNQRVSVRWRLYIFDYFLIVKSDLLFLKKSYPCILIPISYAFWAVKAFYDFLTIKFILYFDIRTY